MKQADAEKIDFNFQPDEWKFERQSGFPGWRHVDTDEWIHDENYKERKNLIEEFQDFKKVCLFFQYNLDPEFAEQTFKEFKMDGFLISKQDE